jgi:hypothetical protein
MIFVMADGSLAYLGLRDDHKSRSQRRYPHRNIHATIRDESCGRDAGVFSSDMALRVLSSAVAPVFRGRNVSSRSRALA